LQDTLEVRSRVRDPPAGSRPLTHSSGVRAPEVEDRELRAA